MRQSPKGRIWATRSLSSPDHHELDRTSAGVSEDRSTFEPCLDSIFHNESCPSGLMVMAAMSPISSDHPTPNYRDDVPGRTISWITPWVDPRCVERAQAMVHQATFPE
jgi:hypothetical protein